MSITVTLLFLLVAGLSGWYGRQLHRRQSVVAEASTTDVEDISEEGVVELYGRIADRESFDSPIEAEECTLAVWEIDEWDNGNWESRASGVYTAPFVLDDGTGRVRVELGDHVRSEFEDATWEISAPGIDVDRALSVGVAADGVYVVSDAFSGEPSLAPDGDPPERIETFEASEPDIPERQTSPISIGEENAARRRYYEQTFSLGDELYLIGEATATDDATYPLGSDDLVVQPREGAEPTVLSDRPASAVLDDLGRYRWAYAVASVAAAAAAWTVFV
jgi:hypothetical protein